ncbi:MAG: cell division protein ZapA [Flavobacteriaceae bacterium]|mgnify:FL=1|nr:cell division protein ZapA [Flavobacteriaceae bacterium]|tara:strand:+ start:997 stop:1293 length:297 start_codon:yes stop_codon:yes gene_type:complete
MDDLLKIKVTIADRVYPMSISANQELSLRSSASKINSTIKKLEQNYAVRDKQDVLAMCALQYAAKLEQNNNNINSSKDQNDEKVSELINIIDVHLNAY